MADKKEEKKEVVGPPIRSGDPRLTAKPVSEQSLPDKAFSMVKSQAKEGGKWKVVTLSFDLETNKAKIDKVEEYEDKYAAFNKFKVKVANEF